MPIRQQFTSVYYVFVLYLNDLFGLTVITSQSQKGQSFIHKLPTDYIRVVSRGWDTNAHKTSIFTTWMSKIVGVS